MSDVTAKFTDAYRTSWLMTLEDHVGKIQTPTDVNNATNITVQCIPLPFLSAYVPLVPDSTTKVMPKDTSDLAKIYSQWGGYAFRVRQGDYKLTEGFAVETSPTKNARFSQPPPIVPMKPSSTLNARVDLPPGVPPLPPGMLRVE
jgi:hypothetical protein